MTRETFESGGVRVELRGLSRTLRALEKAGAKSQDMRQLMHAIGSTVAQAADPPRKTGTLAGSIRAGRGKTKAVVRAGGARAPYAGVQHYGWPARSIPATNFLTNAAQATRARVLAQLDQGLGDLLKETGNG